MWTGDVRGAGTDSNVFIQMYGDAGKTDEYMLRNRTDNFEQAQVDKFKVSLSSLSLQSSAVEQVLHILMDILSWEIAEVVSPCLPRGL